MRVHLDFGPYKAFVKENVLCEIHKKTFRKAPILKNTDLKKITNERMKKKHYAEEQDFPFSYFSSPKGSGILVIVALSGITTEKRIAL